MSILSVQQLHKHYGPVHALKGVSFEVPEGSVFGILGPNGSGKTTLLGIVMDIIKPSNGTFSLFDEPQSEVHRRRIGTLLETPNFYPYLSAVQNLKIAAAIKGQNESDIDRVLGIVDLLQRKHSRFSTYSLGMKQRLAVASCLLGNPNVLVFDEPTNGLDPVGIAETRELIKKLNKEGKTIIMASHLLDEVEKVCTHVAILQKGVLIANGHVDEILINEDVVEVGSSNAQSLLKTLEGYPGSSHVKVHGQHIELFFPNGEAQLENINRFCFEKGQTLNHLRLRKKSLEAKFFELTQNQTQKN
jgi:ABC-2 type transport system ATP-binding protein